jgi:hypothetical protein
MIMAVVKTAFMGRSEATGLPNACGVPILKAT